MPYTFHGEALYYNKALFAKAGIASEPKTYDEFVADAAKLAAAGIPAFTFGGTVNWHVMRLMDVILETECGAEKHDALDDACKRTGRRALRAPSRSRSCTTGLRNTS